MKKKFGLLLIVLVGFAILFTSGCSNAKVFYYGSNVGNEIKGTYKYFKGTETKKIELKEDDVLKMEYASVVDSGTLTMRLIDPNEQVVTEFKADQNGKFEFAVKTPGSYQLIINGEGTEGSFHFAWEIE